MNKIILALLITITLTTAANAQNCVNSERCDELGYNKTTTDCAGLDTLVCPFDENKVFCTTGVTADINCREGDILFSDKTCAPGIITSKTPIGIVFSSINRLAIAFDEKILEWGGYNKEIGSAARGTSGKSNTAAILAYGKTNNISYPAAEYCNTYSTAGTKAGDWYLPSLKELELLSSSYAVVNGKLTAIVGKVTIEEAGYWSSSEDYYGYAWRVVPSSGGTDSYNADYSDRVRPVLAF